MQNSRKSRRGGDGEVVAGGAHGDVSAGRWGWNDLSGGCNVKCSQGGGHSLSAGAGAGRTRPGCV